MARDFIKIDRTTVTATHAQLLLNYISAMRTAVELGIRTKAIMDHNTDGAVFTDIEALFGIPTGQGQTTYNLVDGAVTAATKNLTERVG